MNDKVIKINIDGKEIVGRTSDTILSLASKNGIKIPTLCYHKNVSVYGSCGLCIVEAQGIQKLLRACATKPSDGMVIHTDTPRVRHSRKIALELLMSDHEGDCRGPCTINCPAGTDCQEYLRQIATGDYHGAVKTIKDKIPLPASIGRVCPHPCETKCRRGLVEQPISIAQLKYFAADRVLADGSDYPDVKTETGKKIAIIGGGPAGLSAAYYLRLNGHSVTVYDAMPKMGGMLRYGIPSYRLPKSVLDCEIDEIAALGVEMRNNCPVGVGELSLASLRAKYDAVIIATGAWKSSEMRCPGENLEGVLGGIDFLREIAQYNSGETTQAPEIGDNVAVCGGGNTAMDACRTAVRMGAKNVYVIYRRTRAEMPAEEIEITEAEEEGVIFKFLCNPAEIIGENGRVRGMKLQVMELGTPDADGRRSPVAVEGKFEYLELDTVIMAIGQKVCVKGFEELALNKRGNIVADEQTFMTSIDGVFAIGDATNRGADIAISAIGEANKAAPVVNSYLNGNLSAYRNYYYSECVVNAEMYKDRQRLARAKMPHRPAEVRKLDFDEINLGLDEETAKREAARCLSCGCHDFGECRLIDAANLVKIDPSRFTGEKNLHPVEETLVVIERNPGKCILCGLCVRTCDEVVGQNLIGLIGRGFSTEIRAVLETEAAADVCCDCLLCVKVCPTGALRIIKAGDAEQKTK